MRDTPRKGGRGRSSDTFRETTKTTNTSAEIRRTTIIVILCSQEREREREEVGFLATASMEI